ncbi:cupredoxin family protein [Acidovorax sp. LjRoot66]|uniref:cupredoxin domain-containing protein n=1 Tax=Acidovorax sp. LjRoot66 TaxID=3342334 RepID=UPI003ECDD6DC
MNNLQSLSRLTLHLATAATLLASTGAAWAHGNAPHGTAPKAALPAQQQDWGIAGHPKAVQRTITLRMGDDMRFAPAHIEVHEGETVRLVVHNQGHLLHEIVLGSQTTLAQHAEMMAKHPGMEHDEPYMAHVAAGKRGQIVWQFNRAGRFDFACLIPGHYQAGMVGTINVLPRKG